MPVRKNHTALKIAEYIANNAIVDAGRDAQKRAKGQPVEGYQPLFKILNKLYPTGRRY